MHFKLKIISSFQLNTVKRFCDAVTNIYTNTNINGFKIFLIESQKIVREGLKVLLEEEPDFQIFASDNKDVKISQINQFNPSIILKRSP